MLVFPNAKKLIRFIHFPLICPILLRILCASKESIKCCEKFTRGKIYLSFASLFSKAIQNCFACILLCLYTNLISIWTIHMQEIFILVVFIFNFQHLKQSMLKYDGKKVGKTFVVPNETFWIYERTWLNQDTNIKYIFYLFGAWWIIYKQTTRKNETFQTMNTMCDCHTMHCRENILFLKYNAKRCATCFSLLLEQPTY